jgi:hypothetical protein
MKLKRFFLLILCIIFNSCVSNKTFIEKNLVEEAKDVTYLTRCIKTKKTVSNFFEFKCTGRKESQISFEYKGRYVFFTIKSDEKEVFLQEINYYKNSFHKNIFTKDNLNRFSVGNQTTYRVFMSEDKLSTYMYIINSDDIKVWVLSNGNSVYSP